MLSDLTFLHGSYRERCDSTVDKSFEGYYTIQLISAGEVELFYDGMRYLMKPGDFWPAYPGPHIRFHPAPGHRWWAHRYVAFCGPLATRWMAEGLYPREPQAAPPGWDYVREFDALLAHAHGNGPWDADRFRNALERLFIELAACRGRPGGPSPWLEKTLARLADTSNPCLDYVELAAEVGMSPGSLRRKFKLATGLSPHAYALQCRVGAARGMLEETDLPIKEIAERLGYRDAYFFTRQFRQLAGMPPHAFRKTSRE